MWRRLNCIKISYWSDISLAACCCEKSLPYLMFHFISVRMLRASGQNSFESRLDRLAHYIFSTLLQFYNSCQNENKRSAAILYKLVPKNLHQQWQGEAAGQESYQTFSAPGFQNFLKLCLGARTPPKKNQPCVAKVYLYIYLVSHHLFMIF